MIVVLKSKSLLNHQGKEYTIKDKVEHSFGILRELEAEILCRDTLDGHGLCFHLCHINIDFKLRLEQESGKSNVYKYCFKHKYVG